MVDPALASEGDVDNAFRVARRLDDYAGSFVDLSRDPRTPEEIDRGTPPRDPAPTIVNVSVTSDPEAAEEAIREVWGGGLCLSEATYTEAELRRVQRQVGDLPGMTGSGGASVSSGSPRASSTSDYDCSTGSSVRLIELMQ